MTTHHRDMSLKDLVDHGLDRTRFRNDAPLLMHGVDNGNEGATGLRSSNIGSLHLRHKMEHGRHVAHYRIAWITDTHEGELPLGEWVTFETAIEMYQTLLKMITNAHPVEGDILRTLLKFQFD